jgi:hypothetical protein
MKVARLIKDLRHAAKFPEDMPLVSLSKEAAETVESLRDLVRHCWVHSGYPDCGYTHMTTEQRALYCQVIGRAKREI